MQKRGIVTRVEKDLAYIDVLRPSECGDRCSNCQGECNTKSLRVQVENKLAAQVGDNVELTLSDTAFVGTTFLLYTLPLIIFIIGLFGGYHYYDVIHLPNETMGALLAGFSAMLLCYLVLNRWTARQKNSKGDLLVMSHVIRRENVISSR